MSNEALSVVTGFARQLSRLELRLQLALLFLAIALIGGASALLLHSGADVESLGYPGVFLLSFLGSFAMVLPVPGLIAVCGAGGIGLNLVLVGVLAGTGETIGEVSGYAVGYGSRGMVEGHWFHSLMEAIIRRKPLLVTLFIVFLPIFPALLVLYKYSDKLEMWMERRGMVVLFLVSIIPNPIFDLVGIAAGGARYPVHKFFATVFVGKVLKGVMVAYTCFYGVTLMPWVN